MKNHRFKVSLIIPVYNVEAYIAECIDSATNQTLRDIEIIFIDDKSPDNSVEVIEAAAKDDNRIKIIRNTYNQGVGASRNTGIDAATGRYLKIIDSDDFLEPEALEVLYNEAEKYQADIVFHDAYTYVSRTDLKTYKYPDRLKPLNKMCGHAAWWYLFKSNITKENPSVRFPINAHPHEDTTFSFFLITHCLNHRYIQQPLIFYRQHASMVMNNINGLKRIQADRSAAVCCLSLRDFFIALPKNKQQARKKAYDDLFCYFIKLPRAFGNLPIKIIIIIAITKIKRFIYRSKITQSNKLLVKLFKIPVYRKSL